jgi:DNA-binding NarL/FixJ family response regulator
MADIKVIIFDDNKRIRESLEILFSHTKGFACSGTFPDCNTLLQNIDAAKPDVVLMDIDMPGMNGIDAVKKIRSKHAELEILMLTVFDDDQKIFDAIVAGANGYILKNRSLNRLMDAVKEVHEGGAPMTPSIAKKVLKLFQQANKPETSEEFNLSVREKEVLALLVKGASYKMIADQLKIGYDTVHSHIKNIYKKLRVNSMSEAVAKAIKNKLA